MRLVHGLDDRVGSLEIGKLGDRIVLSHDYSTVPGDQIEDLRFLLTVVDGRIVFAGGYTGMDG